MSSAPNSAACAKATAKAFSLTGISVAKRMVDGLLQPGLMVVDIESSWISNRLARAPEAASKTGVRLAATGSFEISMRRPRRTWRVELLSRSGARNKGTILFFLLLLTRSEEHTSEL